MTVSIRPAEPRDLAALPDIERVCDGVFHEVGIVFPDGAPVIEEVIAQGAPVWVAGDPPVGFAGIIELDGRVHLEQLAVLPQHGRRGIGGALVSAVLAAAAAQGSPGVTLLTFRDVPWNAPFYARHGFTEFPAAQWGPGLHAHWQAEIDAGLHTLGPRLAMHHPLP
ncbi:GNAT family N-acetyltransferase [Nonomuraea sp. NPDC050536]|uniref:GNAT family N-acetyltransferase n=1 Tax=Nonomuraea sp. NPDC050536 TaxID=3364366 RepID=UPI0037C57EB8